MNLRSDIQEIAQMIWTTLFDLPLEATEMATEPAGNGPSVTSFVHIDGAWRGVVMLQCPMALAFTLTSSMFDGTAPHGVHVARWDARCRA